MKTTTEYVQNYGAVSKWLHWGMALILVIMILVGSYMSGLDKTDPSRMELIGMHKSFGVIFMLFALFRLIWSRINHAPELPTVLAGWERVLSRTVTGLLYVLMLAIPFSGFAMTNYFGFPVSLFGVIELPVMFSKNPELAGIAKQVHGILVYALVTAVLLHVAGAVKHRFLDTPEADVLPRMLPMKPRL